MTDTITPNMHKNPKKAGGYLAKTLIMECLLGFFFALLVGIAYFGSGFELEFIYQGF